MEIQSAAYRTIHYDTNKRISGSSLPLDTFYALAPASVIHSPTSSFPVPTPFLISVVSLPAHKICFLRNFEQLQFCNDVIQCPFDFAALRFHDWTCDAPFPRASLFLGWEVDGLFSVNTSHWPLFPAHASEVSSLVASHSKDQSEIRGWGTSLQRLKCSQNWTPAVGGQKVILNCVYLMWIDYANRLMILCPKQRHTCKTPWRPGEEARLYGIVV